MDTAVVAGDAVDERPGQLNRRQLALAEEAS
jgi:hypothetical protein